MLPSRVPVVVVVVVVFVVVVVSQTPRCHPWKLPTLATSRSITKPCCLCVPACPAVLACLRLPGRPVGPYLLLLEAGLLFWSSGGPALPPLPLSRPHPKVPERAGGRFLLLLGRGPQRPPLPPPRLSLLSTCPTTLPTTPQTSQLGLCHWRRGVSFSEHRSCHPTAVNPSVASHCSHAED